MEIYKVKLYGQMRTAVKVRCKQCNLEFLARKDWVDKGKVQYCSSICSNKAKHYNSSIELSCNFCGKKYRRIISKLKNSKSGLNFCSRKCKELAQSIDGNFKEIQPAHYNTGDTTYRKKAFKKYPNICAICGYDRDIRLLVVHHIDSNRKNSNIENLIILCPTCHFGLTLNLYKLTETRELVLIDGAVAQLGER